MARLMLNTALSKRIDRSPLLKGIQQRSGAAVLGLFWQVCSWLPLEAASAFGQGFLQRLGPSLRKSIYMKRNLSLAFPELSEAERNRLLREVWGNAGAVLAEYPHLETICRQDCDAHLETVWRCDPEDYRSGAKRAIFVTAHVGNWELAAAAIVRSGIPLTVVYSPIRNPIIDRMLKRRRQGLGCGLVAREESLRHLMRELSQGRQVGLVVDHRFDGGVALPFFGLDKPTTVAPARLALRFGCDLVPVRVERTGGPHFRVTFWEPVEAEQGVASEKEQAIGMMSRVNEIFEEWIRERPQQWLCTKRAWPDDIAPEVEAVATRS
jgi:KDO2-lipid IV(A) lauroyltransferase